MRFTRDPVYLSGLSYLLRSNDFVKISLDANSIYAPPVLSGLDKENFLGLKKELWLVGYRLSTQKMPYEVENVSFFYMSKNPSYKFVHQIETLEKMSREFRDPVSNLDLRKYFANSKFSMLGGDILEITLPRRSCHSNVYVAFFNKKYSLMKKLFGV